MSNYGPCSTPSLRVAWHVSHDEIWENVLGWCCLGFDFLFTKLKIMPKHTHSVALPSWAQMAIQRLTDACDESDLDWFQHEFDFFGDIEEEVAQVNMEQEAPPVTANPLQEEKAAKRLRLLQSLGFRAAL